MEGRKVTREKSSPLPSPPRPRLTSPTTLVLVLGYYLGLHKTTEAKNTSSSNP